MSTAAISTKTSSISMNYLKRTAGLLKGATGEYIKEAMPITTSTVSSMKDTIKPFTSSLSNISGSVITKTRQLNVQQGMRKINDWFLGMDNMFGGFDVDSDMSFDINVDNASPTEIDLAQLSAEEKSSRQISKTVVETSHKMVEAQLSATANILTSMDKLGAAVISGFDNVNATLNKILEVTTKNTSALIEASVASSRSADPKEKIIGSGKFDFKAYKKMIGNNVSNSEFGMIASILPLLTSGMGKSLLTPENLTGLGLKVLLDKTAPNLKKNMKALDNSLNSMIMSSLIRLGDQRDNAGILGKLGKIFGLNGDRKNVSTERSNIELKAIPFDTISKESLTNAIPGYLRQMLIQMGGPDMVYDYRSRSFKTKSSIGKEFRSQATSMDTFKQASGNVRSTLGHDSRDQNYNNFRDMVYDLLMEDMSGSTRNANNTLGSFKNKAEAKKYIEGLIKDSRIPKGNGKVVDQLAHAFSSLDDRGHSEIKQQIVSNNMKRDSRLRQYKSDADDYEVDLSHVSDSIDENKNEIIKRYTGKSKSSLSGIQSKSNANMVGTDYTNSALFEIYRRLNKGINVYQVGSSDSQLKRFKGMGKLKPPGFYKTDDVVDEERTTPLVSSLSGDKDHTNVLTDETQIDANGNPLTGKQKFGKWASMSGKNVVNALFRGNPEEVRRAFGQMVGDLSAVAAKPIKSFLMGDPNTGKQGIFGKINDSFGNVTGYLKHKFMGAGYEYTNEHGQRVRVSNNDKGGVVGYMKDKTSSMFKGTTDKTKKWFGDVAKYFDFRTDGDKANGDTASKRKSLLAASVGAMAGLGFIGGPIGLIFGAMAGSALQAGGVGGKIKDMLFGKDYTDKKGNQKHKLGLVERAVNGIVDPIRYQMGKTFTAFGSVLKKNILGPLSNIGIAIRDRMADAAGSSVSKAFNKVLGGAGWLLKNLLKIPLSIAKAPLSLLGLGTRAGMRTAGGVTGAGLNSIAKMIAGKNGKDTINDRISKQKFDAKMDDDGSGYYDGYKHWKKGQDEKRKNSPKISDYMSEQQEIIAESSTEIKDNTSKISEDIGTLTHHATHHDPITDSSLYTSDVGLHERIDDMFSLLKDYLETKKGRNGKPIAKDGVSKLSSISGSYDDSNDDSNALLGSAINISSNNGISRDDVESVSSIADEANSSKPNKKSILSRFKNILKSNAEDDEKRDAESKANNNPKSGIFGMIKSGIGNVGNILGDVFGFIKDHPFLSAAGGLVATNFFKNFFGPNEKDKPFMDRLKDTFEESAIGKMYHALADKGPGGKSVIGTITDAMGHVINYLPGLVNGLDTAGGWVNGIINKVSGLLGFKPPMSPNPGGGLATVLNAILITNIASSAAGLAGKFSNLFKGVGKEAAVETAEGVAKEAAKKAAKSTATKVVEETVEGAAKSTISKIATNTTKEVVEQTAVKTTGGFLSNAGNFFNGAKNIGGKALSTVSGATSAAIDAGGKAATYVGSKIAGAAIWAGERVGKGWDAIGDVATKSISGLKSFVTDACSKMSSIAKKSWSSISKKASNIGSTIKGSLQSLGNDIEIIKKLGSVNLDEGGGVFKKVISIMFDVGEKFGPALGKLLKFFTKIFGSLIGFVLDAVFNIFNTGDIFADKEDIGTIEKVSAGIAGAIAGQGNGIWDGFDVTDIINALFNALKWGQVGAILVGSVGTIALPLIGTVAGGVVGFVIGCIVGALISLLVGSDNIARFMDMVITKIINFFGGGSTAKGYGSGAKTISCNTNSFNSSPYYQNNYSNNLNMKKAGCGPIAASYLANAYGKDISPSQAAKMLNGTSYRDRSGGTSADGIAAIGNNLGLNMRSGPIDARSITQKLSNGEPVAFLGKSNNPNSPYTNSGHFIVGEGIDSQGNISVMDPLSPNKKKYKAQNLINGLEGAAYATSGSGRGYGPGENSNIDLVQGFPYLRQGGDAPWANKMYGTASMAESACGPTSMAMVLSGASNKFVDPYDIAKFSVKTGNRVPNVGTSWKLFPDAAKEFGLNVKENNPSKDFVDSSISSGKPVILSGQGSRDNTPFTSAGHFVVAVGKQGDNYLINDPAGRPGAYSWNQLTGAKNAWAFDNKGKGILNRDYNSTNDPDVINLSSLNGYSNNSSNRSSGGTLSQVFDIVKNAGSKLLGFLNFSSGNSGSNILSKGSNVNVGNYPADDNASSILFSKIQNLDTTYADYPGRNLQWSDASNLDFIIKVAPGVQATIDCGVLASLRIAQAILESGWGKSGLAKKANNLFGMKAFSGWSGKRINMPTGEWSASQGNYTINADFRAYSSWSDSIADQAKNYINTSNYKEAGLLGEKDYREACVKVRKAGYATDPNYATGLIKVIDDYALTYFDHPKTKSNSSSAMVYGPQTSDSYQNNQESDYGSGGVSAKSTPNYSAGNLTGGFGMGDNTDISAITAVERKRSSLSRRNDIRAQGGTRGKGPSQANYSSKSGYSLSVSNGKGVSADNSYQNNQDVNAVLNSNNNSMGSCEKLELLLSSAVIELKSINNNTGRSTDVLAGLAKASSGTGPGPIPQRNRSRGPSASSNNTNVSSVMSIVKPI